MINPKINKNKIIKIKPQYRVWGVLVKNKKNSKLLKLTGAAAIICGIISIIILIIIISHFYIS